MEPYVSAADYAVCYENHTAISAEEFQNEVSFLNLSDRLGFPLHPREVLEIDDGLHPYFFYLDDETASALYPLPQGGLRKEHFNRVLSHRGGRNGTSKSSMKSAEKLPDSRTFSCTAFLLQ